MKKDNYESLLDAFRELSSVTDEEILTPKAQKLVKEGKDFSLSFNGPELEAARQALELGDDDDEIEVIDVNADTLEHVRDKKEYIGQVIVQCNKCHSNKFVDMEKLIASEDDEEVYNIEDECPNCHTAGDGFELVGQVAKVVKDEPVEQEVVPEDQLAAEEETEPDTTDQESDEAEFENNQEEETDEEEQPEEQPEPEEAEELDFAEEEKDDEEETTASEDEDDDLELSELGDEFDSDNVRKDDTEEDDEELDDEEKVKEELQVEAVEEPKPVRKKLRLPTREALQSARAARVKLTEELLHKFVLPESINKVIVDSGSKKIYEGLVEELPEDIVNSDMEGFNVANGYLMCNIDPAVDEVDVPLAKVLNCFNDDDTTKIIIWDCDTNEELLQGSKADALKKFGHCQLVSLDAPKTLRLTIKGDHACNCQDGECVCDDVQETPEDKLCDRIFTANDLAKYNAEDQKAEEFWIMESIYNKEDLPHIFERYIKGTSAELIEEFKAVTGFKDELDEIQDKYKVKLVDANEGFKQGEFTELLSLAKKLDLETFSQIQDFAKQHGNVTDSALLDALRKAAAAKDVATESLDVNESVTSFKTRRALSEALSKIKGTDVQYRVARSLKEGYRYDLVVEAVPSSADFNEEDYMKEAELFAKEIKKFNLTKVENLYYDDYQFDRHEPEDAAEQLIADALVARIKEITGEDPTTDDSEDSPEEYLKQSQEFADEISSFSLIKAEELYYDDYGFDTHKPEDEAEKIIADALIARIKEITTKEPVIFGEALAEDFEEEDVEIDDEDVDDEDDDIEDDEEAEKADPEESHILSKELLNNMVANGELDAPEDVEETEPEDESEVDDQESEEEFEEIPDDETEESEEDEQEPEEEKEVEAIDVIKDKLDIHGEGDMIIVAEKGQLDNPDAPKIETEVTEEESAALEAEFHEEEETDEEISEPEDDEEISEPEVEPEVAPEAELLEEKPENNTYVLTHTVHSYEGDDTDSEVYSTLEKAKEELKKWYELCKENYDEIDEEESYISEDGMKAFLAGTGGGSYELIAGDGIWDKFEIKEKIINEALVDIKPFFTKVSDEKEDIDFDVDAFDADMNSYFDEAYEETVLYKTGSGTIDQQGNILLEGVIRTDKNEANVLFTLTPETAITEALDSKTLEEKIKTATFKVSNNLSEEVFTFNFGDKK